MASVRAGTPAGLGTSADKAVALKAGRMPTVKETHCAREARPSKRAKAANGDFIVTCRSGTPAHTQPPCLSMG